MLSELTEHQTPKVRFAVHIGTALAGIPVEAQFGHVDGLQKDLQGQLLGLRREQRNPISGNDADVDLDRYRVVLDRPAFGDQRRLCIDREDQLGRPLEHGQVCAVDSRDRGRRPGRVSDNKPWWPRHFDPRPARPIGARSGDHLRTVAWFQPDHNLPLDPLAQGAAPAVEVRSDLQIVVSRRSARSSSVDRDLAADAVNQVLGAGADLVALVNEAADDRPIRVGYEGRRKWNAVGRDVAGEDLGVQYPETADHLGVHVREHRIFDVIGRREVLECEDVVIGDRVELGARFGEVAMGIAQLNELRKTRGSPDCRSVEDHHSRR